MLREFVGPTVLAALCTELICFVWIFVDRVWLWECAVGREQWSPHEYSFDRELFSAGLPLVMSAVENFLDAPSESLLLSLTVKELINVADYYSIEITLPRSARKDRLVDFIRECLKTKKVLPFFLYSSYGSRSDDQSKVRGWGIRYFS